MNDSEGHNYFFPVSKTWKENRMALLDRETAKRLDAIEARLESLERAIEALLEEQEDVEDAIHDETA